MDEGKHEKDRGHVTMQASGKRCCTLETTLFKRPGNNRIMAGNRSLPTDSGTGTCLSHGIVRFDVEARLSCSHDHIVSPFQLSPYCTAVL